MTALHNPLSPPPVSSEGTPGSPSKTIRIHAPKPLGNPLRTAQFLAGAQMRLAHTYLLLEEVERTLDSLGLLPAAATTLRRALAATGEAQSDLAHALPTKERT